VRVIEDSERRKGTPGERDMRKVAGGLLVQDADNDIEDRVHMEVVTDRKPTEEEWGELLFAWKVGKHVRSNAIVLAHGLATIGIGAGQMSRVDSVRLAVDKARENRADQLQGSAMASDAFLPFADGVEAAIEAGVTAVIQPGGSRRDQEVIEAANRAGISMVFTGRRHFRH
jgi:phosphoribosylaminoimidazolecarboxamide formyltransferase/IMP cyclohydrolase